MKKLLTALFISLCLLNCNNKKRELSLTKENELKIFVTESFKKFDSSIVVDTFRLIRLDTISLFNKYSGIMGGLLDEMESINLRSENYISQMKSNVQIANLSQGLSPVLFENAKTDFEENKKKINENIKEVKILSGISDSLSKLSKKADTVKPVAYYAVCLYQIRNTDQSIKKDTFFVLLNTEKNIINKDDFFSYKP